MRGGRADVQDVSRGIGLDNRIGRKFLHAWPGYGGSCFPKDTLALLKTAEDYEAPVRIVEAVVRANDARKRPMGRKVIAERGRGEVRGKTVALPGLTFKPNTDDMRDAPSIAIGQSLIDAGVTVRAFDPEGEVMAWQVMPAITYCGDPDEAATGADAVALVTEWGIFRALDLKRLASRMTAPVLVDLRNVYDRAEAEKVGFSYTSGGGKAYSDPELTKFWRQEAL